MNRLLEVLQVRIKLENSWQGNKRKNKTWLGFSFTVNPLFLTVCGDKKVRYTFTKMHAPPPPTKKSIHFSLYMYATKCKKNVYIYIFFLYHVSMSIFFILFIGVKVTVIQSWDLALRWIWKNYWINTGRACYWLALPALFSINTECLQKKVFNNVCTTTHSLQFHLTPWLPSP